MKNQEPVTGASLFADTLIALGARHVFNISGTGILCLSAAFIRRSDRISYISHFNETNLALMAQGYARQTGRPAFCIVYHASGTALSLISLTTAWADHIPLVLVSTVSSTQLSGRDQYAGAPASLLEMGRQFAKWSYDVTVPERIPEILARAYSIAAEPPMGPVHITIPSDLYHAAVSGEIPRTDYGRTRSFVQDRADERGLTAVSDMLTRAAFPVIMAGSEVGQLGAVDALIDLAETLRAPVMLELQPSFMSFPTSHPQYVGPVDSNAALLEKADAVFVIGAEFTQNGFPGGDKKFFSPSLPVAVLSVDRMQLTKQLFPDIALAGHPKPSLARLTALVKQNAPSAKQAEPRLAQCAERRAHRRKVVDAVRRLDRRVSPVASTQVIQEIREVCGQDWIIVQAGSMAGFHFDHLYEIDDPSHFHSLSIKGSAQGWAGPAATGIQLAAPDRRVVVLIGDGNLMFSGTSIWGAAKNKLPMVFVVINNRGWDSMYNAHKRWADLELSQEDLDRLGMTFGEAPVDYAGFAASMGVKASKARTAEELASCLRAASAAREPWLIEVVTAGENQSGQMLKSVS